jgi:hypothetical protein
MPHTTARAARALFVVLVLLGAAFPAAAEDRRLVGAWKALTYVIDGTPHQMHGLFIFTDGHYSANVRFKLSTGPIDDANGNAGPYTADGKRVVFSQWVQIHVRPGDAKEPVLSREGPDEGTDYRIDGNRLILTFPSKNQYILERVGR